MKENTFKGVMFAIALIVTQTSVAGELSAAERDLKTTGACRLLPHYDQLVAAFRSVLAQGGNGGIGAQAWGALVNRDGIVCALVFSGRQRGDQLPAGRLVAVQKATTANASSIPGFAFSTANLYTPVQPGGMLFSLPETTVLQADIAYRGSPRRYGRPDDPLVGHILGGSTVLAGGLALYGRSGRLIGGLGISGDLPCTDHIVAWKVRDSLGLDFVPFGPSSSGDDNIVNDITPNPAGGTGISPSGWGYPVCTPDATDIAAQLPETYPTGR